jgi:outer membrane protein assembly factor BamD (BamD/ComL family)
MMPQTPLAAIERVVEVVQSYRHAPDAEPAAAAA